MTSTQSTAGDQNTMSQDVEVTAEEDAPDAAEREPQLGDLEPRGRYRR